MKVYVKLLSGPSCEFELENDATIFELRNIISNRLDKPFFQIQIANMRDQNGNHLGKIYKDDPIDASLLNFLRSQNQNPDLNIEKLTIFMVRSLGPGDYRPTVSNPKGISAEQGYKTDPHNAFFKSVVIPNPIGFRERLENINLDVTEIPKEFFDPITNEIMNTPVIASNQRCFDLTTLQGMNFMDPFSSGSHLSDYCSHNLQLREKMELFIKEKETESNTIRTVLN